MSEDDRVMEHLKSEDDRANFLNFGRLFADIEYPCGLKIEEPDQGSWPGRKIFWAVLSKPTWHGPGASDSLPFNIHIELQFDRLNHRFSHLLLHYGLDPYTSEREARTKYPRQQIKAYLRERSRFEYFVSQKDLEGLSIGGGWNQIGKMDMPVDETTTIGEFQKMLLERIPPLSSMIDKFFGS